MSPIAHLETALDLEYTDRCGRERFASLQVEYDFDGGDHLNITGIIGSYSEWDEDVIEDHIYRHLDDVAPEAYAEWQDERGEYLRDAALDREAA